MRPPIEEVVTCVQHLAPTWRKKDKAMAAETTAYTDRDRAFHEAGHAVLAAQLGVEVERVSIVPIPGARSYTKLPAHAGLSTAEEAVR